MGKFTLSNGKFVLANNGKFTLTGGAPEPQGRGKIINPTGIITKLYIGCDIPVATAAQTLSTLTYNRRSNQEYYAYSDNEKTTQVVICKNTINDKIYYEIEVTKAEMFEESLSYYVVTDALPSEGFPTAGWYRGDLMSKELVTTIQLYEFPGSIAGSATVDDIPVGTENSKLLNILSFNENFTS